MKKINCVVCNNSVILTVLDLGKSPLANNLVSFKNAKLKEKKYPLVMGQCSKCNHVQLKYFINPKLMFDNYYMFLPHQSLCKNIYNQFQLQ
jgi:hypothetical protein